MLATIITIASVASLLAATILALKRAPSEVLMQALPILSMIGAVLLWYPVAILAGITGSNNITPSNRTIRVIYISDQ